MNDVKLNKPLYCDKKYVIFLDSNNRFVFNSQRAAKDFLVRISQEIDKAVLLITEELNTVTQLYRFYRLSDTDYKFKYNVGNNIDFIHNRLAWIDEHSDSTNHDTIVFQSLINCFYELIESFNCCKAKAAQRKDTINKRRCALKTDILKMYLKSFTDIGIKPEVYEFKIKKAL